MRTLVLFAVWSAGLIAADAISVTLLIRVPPEAALTMAGTEAVNVKIRLPPKSEARVWIGESCSASAGESSSITQSGTFVIPLSSLPGTGHLVCLADASDGILRSVSLDRIQQ